MVVVCCLCVVCCVRLVAAVGYCLLVRVGAKGSLFLV